VLINVMPLLTFVSLLSNARVKGIHDYHAMVAHHHLNFDDKWIGGQGKQKENILGNPDISSAADISMVYEAVKGMSVFPFNIKTMATTVVVSLLPVLGVFALEIPLADLIKMLMGILM
jgi:hypothetical protein